MRVLYVLSVQAEDTSAPMDELSALEPTLEVHTATGAAAALVEIRARGGYGAVFLSPHLPHNEALALVATLRRDRAPVAIVAIITEVHRPFLAPAITAGADDVLVWGESGYLAAEETLRRVRHSRHLERPEGEPLLQVLYVGQDDLAVDLLADMAFVQAGRTTAAADGTCALGLVDDARHADVIIVDEQPGEGHALQVVKWLKAHAPAIPVVVLTSPTGHDVGGAALELGADDVVSKAGTYRRRLVATLHRHHLRMTTGTAHGSPAASPPDTTTPAPSAGPVEPTEPIEAMGAIDAIEAIEAIDPDEPVDATEAVGTDEPLGAARPFVLSAPEPSADDESGDGEETVASDPGESDGYTAPRLEGFDQESNEIARMRSALAAETRIRDLTADVHSLGARLDAQRQSFEELQESQKFERAMRDRDREELVRLSQGLTEERERRIVLEGTLRQTEDRAAKDTEALETRHADVRRSLEAQLGITNDRLRQVTHDAEVFNTRLQNELSEQAADRDRLVRSQVFGWATVTQEGTLVRCNTAFARMFGFAEAADVLDRSAGPFSGLADHAHVVAQLQAGVEVERVETTLHRANGRPFRALTSAAFRASGEGRPATIERVVVDLDDRTQIEERLRLARRLESAGRLAAEMAPTIEPLLGSIDDPEAAPADRRQVITLVRQLLAYSRHQAKPAGLLSLHDAVRRAESQLRRIAGDAVTVELRLQDVGTVAASEDDLEQLLAALVFAASGSLPYGGSIVLETRPLRAGFEQRIGLAVSATGYGVHSATLSSLLTRLVTKCGGTVHVLDESARATTLHVNLPC